MGSNYLPGADDIYVSPSQIRRFGLRTGILLRDQLEHQKREKDISHYYKSVKLILKKLTNSNIKLLLII